VHNDALRHAALQYGTLRCVVVRWWFEGEVIDWCRYVERFRHAAPLSREHREKQSVADAAEFWWLSEKDTSSDQSALTLENMVSSSVVKSR